MACEPLILRSGFPKHRVASLSLLELDERVNAGIDDITEAMEQGHKTFEKVIYPGAQHAFHNDTNPDRYHPEAARLAWQRTLAWLRLWLE